MTNVNPNRTSLLVKELLDIWQCSVKASHGFLTEKDRLALIPLVEQGLLLIPTLVIVYDNKRTIGFMGIDEQKLEMLFLHPEYFGQDIGKKLVNSAIVEHNVRYVDVNEQNPKATAFYKACGFEVFAHHELDAQGKAFPILEMRLK